MIQNKFRNGIVLARATTHRVSVAVDGVLLLLVNGFSSGFRIGTSDQASRTRLGGDRGQTTAEYALVLIGVAALALLVLAWATSTGKVGELLDKVFDSVIDKVP